MDMARSRLASRTFPKSLAIFKISVNTSGRKRSRRSIGTSYTRMVLNTTSDIFEDDSVVADATEYPAGDLFPAFQGWDLKLATKAHRVATVDARKKRRVQTCTTLRKTQT